MKTRQETLWSGEGDSNVLRVGVEVVGEGVQVHAEAKDWIIGFPTDSKTGEVLLTIGTHDPLVVLGMFRQICWKLAMVGYDPFILQDELMAAIVQVAEDTSEEEWT